MRGRKGFYGRNGIKSVLLLSAILLIFLFTGCDTKDISMDVKHTPLYESTIHKSTIKAKVKSSDGVKSIAIKIIKGKLVDRLKLSDPPSVIPLRKDAATFTKIYNYSITSNSIIFLLPNYIIIVLN